MKSTSTATTSTISQAQGDAQPAAGDAQVISEKKASAWERFSFSVAHGAVSCLLLCLGLNGLYRFGRLFGTVEWLINYRRRRRFTAALERIWGRRPTPAERRHWGRDFFVRGRCDKLFYLIFDRIPRERALSLLRIENQELLDTALARGKGVYVALSHHGAHHIGGMLMVLGGYKVAGVRDRHEGAIRRFVQARFDRLYPEFQRTRVLYAESFPRDIYRCYRDGYVIGAAMDIARVRKSTQRMETLTLFGEERVFVSGPLRIAIRCGAPVLQGFLIPGPGFALRLVLLGLLPDPDAIQSEDEAVSDAMRQYAANVEHYVRTWPSLITRLW